MKAEKRNFDKVDNIANESILFPKAFRLGNGDGIGNIVYHKRGKHQRKRKMMKVLLMLWKIP